MKGREGREGREGRKGGGRKEGRGRGERGGKRRGGGCDYHTTESDDFQGGIWYIITRLKVPY